MLITEFNATSCWLLLPEVAVKLTERRRNYDSSREPSTVLRSDRRDFLASSEQPAVAPWCLAAVKLDLFRTDQRQLEPKGGRISRR